MSEEIKTTQQTAPTRNVRVAAAGKRTTRAAAMRQRTQDAAEKTKKIDNPESENKETPKVTGQTQLLLKKFCPVYIVRADGSDDTCAMCRNKLDETCTTCQVNRITDPNQCRIIEGRCGHRFHQHCLDGWIRRSPYCPCAHCGLRWENA